MIHAAGNLPDTEMNVTEHRYIALNIKISASAEFSSLPRASNEHGYNLL
jgi:hypothetical protein